MNVGQHDIMDPCPIKKINIFFLKTEFKIIKSRNESENKRCIRFRKKYQIFKVLKFELKFRIAKINKRSQKFKEG
jgi:hypothetical protein